MFSLTEGLVERLVPFALLPKTKLFSLVIGLFGVVKNLCKNRCSDIDSL
jgi:hypothetical protein